MDSKRSSPRENPSYTEKIQSHYVSVWGRMPAIKRLGRGPVHELPDEFKVLEFAPSQRNFWTYATCGLSLPKDERPIELHLFSPCQCADHVELLTVIAHYHRTGSRLDLAHTVNFGRPWMVGSECEYGLISLPYLDGPKLEMLSLPETTVKFYWLIPITKIERDYASVYGLNAIETLFEERAFNYLDPRRKSVVPA